MDSRFRLKVEFSIYGKTFNWEPSLNWYSVQHECDPRISKWFADCHEKARADWERNGEAERAIALNKLVEVAERAELERLKRKYEK